MTALILSLALIASALSVLYIYLCRRLKTIRKELEILRSRHNLLVEIVEAMETLPPHSSEWKKFIPRCEEVDRLCVEAKLPVYSLTEIVKIFAGIKDLELEPKVPSPPE